MRFCIASFLVLFAIGCAGGAPSAPTPGTAPAVSGAPNPQLNPTVIATQAPGPKDPSDTSRGPLTPLPAALTCNGDPTRPALPPPPTSIPPQLTAGQMTEEAAQARRLYDAERWNEAYAALTRVTSGETGDDQGNQQIAAYLAAAALFRLKKLPESFAAFRAIAERPEHLKHGETQLWLAKFAIVQPALIDVAVFATYSAKDVARYDNNAQRALYETLSYLLGRARIQQGGFAEARDLFSHVSPTHAYGPDAKKCLEFLQQRAHRW